MLFKYIKKKLSVHVLLYSQFICKIFGTQNLLDKKIFLVTITILKVTY